MPAADILKQNILLNSDNDPEIRDQIIHKCWPQL